MGFIQRIADSAKSVGNRARDLGELAGDKARDLTRKSSDLIEVTKIKHELRKLEKEMENNLAGIGALYYQNQQGREDTGDELNRLIEATRQLEIEMKELEEQIEAVQPKPPACPECGSELAENAKFCSNCGRKIAD